MLISGIGARCLSEIPSHQQTRAEAIIRTTRACSGRITRHSERAVRASEVRFWEASNFIRNTVLHGRIRPRWVGAGLTNPEADSTVLLDVPTSHEVMSTWLPILP